MVSDKLRDTLQDNNINWQNAIMSVVWISVQRSKDSISKNLENT